MNDKSICSARFGFNLSKILKMLLVIYYITVCIMFIVKGPAKNENVAYNGTSQVYSYQRYETKYIWGRQYYFKNTAYMDEEYISDRARKHGDDIKINSELDKKVLIRGIIISIALIFVPIVLIALLKRNAKSSSLDLYQNKINGRNKNIFEDKYIDVPIEKIKDVRVKSGLIDKFGCYDTLIITTEIEEYSLKYVQNAVVFAQELKQIMEKTKSSH